MKSNINSSWKILKFSMFETSLCSLHRTNFIKLEALEACYNFLKSCINFITDYKSAWRAYFNSSIHPSIYNTMINVGMTGVSDVFTVFPFGCFFPLFVCLWTWWNNLSGFICQWTTCLQIDSIESLVSNSMYYSWTTIS